MGSPFHSASGDPGPGPIVIVGAGLAGLYTALKLAPLPVTVIAAAPMGEGASSIWAQGGVAAAVGEGDTAEAHAADTIAAGAGIVDPDIAITIASEGRARILDLSDYGVPFDRGNGGAYVLSREAAHNANRVVRVSGDRAGFAIMKALIARVRATPSIRMLEGYSAIGLVKSGGRVSGVKLIKSKPGHQIAIKTLDAGAVVLATGGVGSLYAVTTNPTMARGEAIAFAARAGAVIADAEFVQFHPTALDVGIDPAPLATEALRGEGATLVNRLGERFMLSIDPRAELSPRDIVARGVFAEIKAGRGAYLDCRTEPGARLAEAFPTVYAFCKEAGLDPAHDLLPVAPAAHYHMGGVATDVNGRTSIAGLWAAGEVASTGLHGANRLASNSLLEAVVVGDRVAADIKTRKRTVSEPVELPLTADAPFAVDQDHRADALLRLRATMSENVGVIREAEGLAMALAVIGDIEAKAGRDVVLANMALAARLIASGALARHESRGGHWRADYPFADPALAQRSFVRVADGGRIEPLVTGPKSRRNPNPVLGAVRV
ncbi:MAG: L-aspartate oxidase [Hyphomicrobiaceae bacterium]